MAEENREATQEFVVRNILIGNCGCVLTPEKINLLAKELIDAMTEGPTSWAFKPENSNES